MLSGCSNKIEDNEKNNTNNIESNEIKSKQNQFLEDKGYKIISSNGVVESYILGSDTLVGPNYGLIWGIQSVTVDDYIGKTIDTYGFIVKNHKLDTIGDKNETLVWLLVCEGEIIGGYSLPNSSEPLYGGVYSIDGETLEEVTGIDFQTWREEWEGKYKK